MEKSIKKVIIRLMCVGFVLFVYSCNKNVADSNNDNVDNVGVINNDKGENTKESQVAKSEQYDLWSYTIELPIEFKENSKTPNNIMFLVDKIPIIINNTVLGEDYTNEKVEELKNNLNENFKKRFNILTSEHVEEDSINKTKGRMCKYTGYIQGDNEYIQNNEFIQESYILSDASDKSMYVFTIFCINNGENNKVIKKFEDMLTTLKKK